MTLAFSFETVSNSGDKPRLVKTWWGFMLFGWRFNTYK
jgi:hypothetical protein